MTVVIMKCGEIEESDDMRREQKKEQTRIAIVQHAVRLFKLRGFHQVTVEEITEACGIAKGTFFNYFPKKETILLEIGDSHLPLLTQIMDRNQEGDLKTRLLGIFRELIEIYSDHSELLRLALAETVSMAIRTGRGAANLAVIQESISGIIEEAKANGSFRSRWDSASIASLLIGILLHTLTLGNRENDRSSVGELFARQVDLAWGGVERV